jgi:hypothetical protein
MEHYQERIFARHRDKTPEEELPLFGDISVIDIFLRSLRALKSPSDPAQRSVLYDVIERETAVSFG